MVAETIDTTRLDLHADHREWLAKYGKAFYDKYGYCLFCGCHQTGHGYSYFLPEEDRKLSILSCLNCERDLQTNQVLCWIHPETLKSLES